MTFLMKLGVVAAVAAVGGTRCRDRLRRGVGRSAHILNPSFLLGAGGCNHADDHDVLRAKS